jgi:hypothetical protein
MAGPLFDIVFRGDIVNGHNINDVKGRLAQLFRVDSARIEALFGGGLVPLKRDLDEATAEKYRAVLIKAGAQVQVRPAGGAAKGQPEAGSAGRPKTVAASSPSPASATSSSVAGTLTLAPAGSNLLDGAAIRKVQPLNVDVSGITLRPLEGDLLDASEKRPLIAADIDTSDFDLAEPGVDLLEGFRSEPLPLPELEPEFDLAEAGADLLDGTHRKQIKTVQVDSSHLEILPIDHS